MKHIGAFCQLAKIFMESYRVLHDWTQAEKEEAKARGVTLPPYRVEFVRQTDLLSTPSRIHQPERFVLSVGLSGGTVEFVFGQPLPIVDDGVAMFLTGGPEGIWCRETDWSGLAVVSLSPEHQGALLQAQMNGDFKAIEAIQEELKALRRKAEEISARRVRAQIDQIMRSMKSQLSECAEARIPYKPSTVERLCTIVLDKELDEERERNREANAIFERQFANVASSVG